jgi:hypothetical protein
MTFPPDVLIYSKATVSRATIRRRYQAWRKEQGLPNRCDNDQCKFHTEPLVWNGEPFTPILDHRNGNNSDNRPKNLRYLCPLCDAQLVETRGGANKGRVEKAEGGFAIRNKSTGLRGFTLIAKAAHYEISTQPVTIERAAIITVEPTGIKKDN